MIDVTMVINFNLQQVTPRGGDDGRGCDARLRRCEDSPHAPLLEDGDEGGGGRATEAQA